MFVDYVTLMLINLAAGLVLLALYVYLGLDRANQTRWAPGFAMTGLVALVTGLHMSFYWPLPSSYNIAFGEMSAMFGVLFLGAALALALSWELVGVAIYGFFAGLAAIVIGIGMISRGMSEQPLLAGIGYILAGLGGVLAVPAWFARHSRTVRTIAALVLLAAAAIWAITGYGAYWQHLGDFAKWAPTYMQK
jgi:putative membrane protein